MASVEEADEFEADMVEDYKSEASKYGRVISTTVDRGSSSQLCRIFIEFDKINDAVCLSNQRSCPSGIWPGPGKKGKEKGTGGAN